MATFELANPDGSTIQVEAETPEEAFKTQDSILHQQKISADVKERAKRYPSSSPGVTDVALNAALLGGLPQVKGAMGAVAQAVMSPFGGGHLDNPATASMADVYARERDIARRQLQEKVSAMGLAAVPVELAGGFAAAPGRVLSAAAAAPSLAKQLGTAAGYGAAYGGASGAITEEGSWLDKLRSAGEGTIGGALLGPAAHLGLKGVGAGYRFLRNAPERLMGALFGRGEPAQGRARSFFEAGVKPPGIAMVRPAMRKAGQAVSGTMVGNRIRQDVARTRQELQNVRRDTLPPGETATETGEQAQALLKKGIGTPDEAGSVANLSREELQDISGVGPGPGYTPTMPAVKAASVTPVTRDDVIERYARRGNPPPERPTVTEPVKPDWLVNQQNSMLKQLETNAARQRELKTQAQSTTEWLKQNGYATESATGLGLTATGRKSFDAKRAWRELQTAKAEAKGLKDQQNFLQFDYDTLLERWTLMQEEGRTAAAQAKQAQAKRFAQADQAAERLTARRQNRADVQAQTIANEERLRETRLRQEQAKEPVALPERPESFTTQLAAGERALSLNAPKMAAPLMGRRGEKSFLATELENVAKEARSASALPGFKRLFSPEDESVDPVFMEYIKGKLGNRAAQMLEQLATQRQFGHRIQGSMQGAEQMLQDLQSLAKNPRVDKALLSRVTQAIEKDIQRLAALTPEGQFWAKQREQVRALKKKLNTEVLEPLKGVMGETNPALMIRTLRRAMTQPGDARQLKAFLQVAESKGNRNTAVSWLLNDMADESMENFAKKWRQLTPEAKNLLFAGSTKPLGLALERQVKAAEALAKASGGGRGNFGVLHQLRDTTFGLVALTTMPSLLSAVAGAKGLDIILTSPKFQNWLLSVPAGRGSKAMMDHMAKLSAFSPAALGLDQDTGQRVKDAIVAWFNQEQGTGQPTSPAQASRVGGPKQALGQVPGSAGTESAVRRNATPPTAELKAQMDQEETEGAGNLAEIWKQHDAMRAEADRLVEQYHSNPTSENMKAAAQAIIRFDDFREKNDKMLVAHPISRSWWQRLFGQGSGEK